MSIKRKLFLFAATWIFAASRLFANDVEVGQKGTDFKLKNVDGNMVSLKNYENAKGFILIFTCNHCPYAKAYEDRIIALHKKYESKGYPVVAINPNDPTVEPDDSFEKMKERAKEKSFPFAYLFDESQETAKAYGAARTPHVFILDKDLTVQYIGAIDNNYKDANAVTEKYVEDALDAILQGETVKNNFTKAIGCTIKWKK